MVRQQPSRLSGEQIIAIMFDETSAKLRFEQSWILSTNNDDLRQTDSIARIVTNSIRINLVSPRRSTITIDELLFVFHLVGESARSIEVLFHFIRKVHLLVLLSLHLLSGYLTAPNDELCHHECH